MNRFESLPHRLEEIAQSGKVIFVNDSKATNAEAAARALEAFDAIFWIAGGRAKDGGVTDLLDRLDQVRGAYLIGEAAGEFNEGLKGLTPCYECGDLDTAVTRAYEHARQSDAQSPVVLLSPACSSYDQFANFVERGNAFRKLVTQLSSVNGAAA